MIEIVLALLWQGVAVLGCKIMFPIFVMICVTFCSQEGYWDSGGSIKSSGSNLAAHAFIFGGVSGLRIGCVAISGDDDCLEMWFLVRWQLVSLLSKGTLLALWLLDVVTLHGCVNRRIGNDGFLAGSGGCGCMLGSDVQCVC